MSDARMDPERIGALINGRLTQEERAEVLAHLTSSEQDRSVFADTAAVLRALEEEEAAESTVAAVSPQVPPTPALLPEGIQPAREWAQGPLRRVPRWAWGAVAAAVMLAVALSAVLRRGPGTLPPPEDHLAVLVMEDAVPPGEVPRWVLRGDAADADVRASRLGVVHVHLRLTFAGNDRARRDSLLAVARALVRDDPALDQAYTSLSRPRSTKDELAAVGDSAGRTFGQERFRLGAWAEAARLASLSENEAFIHARWTRRVLNRAAVLPDLSDEAYNAVDDLRGVLPPVSEVDWTLLRQATVQLVTALTQ